MKLVGIGLIIFGVVVLIFQGFTFMIPKEVFDLGVYSITVYEQRTIPLAPIVGGVSLAVGIALVLLTGRGRSTA